MLKLILWKVGQLYYDGLRRYLRYSTVEKLFPGLYKTERYFAFGANLDPQVLRQRNVEILQEQEFVLNDYALGFTQPSSYLTMGFAAIQLAINAKVFGKIYTIYSLDARRLDYFEVVPHIHRHHRVYLQHPQGSFYYYAATSCRNDLKPSRQYLEKICNGLKTFRQPPLDYIRQLEGVETLDTLTTNPLPYFLYRRYPRRPRWLVNLLVGYDRFCARLFAKHLYPYRSYKPD